MSIEKMNNPFSTEQEKTPMQHGIESSLRLTNHDKLEAGDGMGWTGDDIFYEVKEIIGDEAVIWVPGDEKSQKTVNKKELYDPYTAKRIANLVEQG